MDDLSLRHIPDLSDTSATADFSEASFQIPHAAGNTDDLLLADDTMDFFNGANDTLTTPAPPSRPAAHRPLTLAELTPRSKPVRTAPIRSSLRPRPGIATPLKAAVADDLSAALAEELSPFRNQDPSFQIPSQQAHGEDLLLAEEGSNFFQADGPSLDSVPSRARSPLTLSQLSPRKRASPSPSASSISHVMPSPSYVPSNHTITNSDINPIDVSDSESSSTAARETNSTTNIITPVTAEAVPPSPADQCPAAQPAQKGIVKGRPDTNRAEGKKKLPGGEKAKRKRVTPVAAVTKPAKLKPLTASIARRVSLAGRKPVPGVRRRPLQAQPQPATAAAATKGVSVRRTDNAAQSASSAVHTDVKPPRAVGALANTLMSFGQRLMANTVGLEHNGDAVMANEAPDTGVPEADVPAPIALQSYPESPPDDGLHGEAVAGPSNSLSPRGPGGDGAASTTLASGSGSPAGAPMDALDQPVPEPQVSKAQRSPSPMRRSIKRAGSPAGEPPAQKRKRSKTTSGPSAPSSSKEPAPRKPALQPSRTRNTPAAGPNAGAARARRVVSASASGANLGAKADGAHKPPTAPSKSLSRSGPDGVADAAKLKGPGRGEIVDGDSGAPVASTSRGVRLAGAGRSQKENSTDTKERPAHEHRDAPGHASSVSRGPPSVDRPPANLLSAKPTRPMEFQFATSMRSEARRGDLEKSAGSSGAASLRQSKAHAAHPIPDFKALHALQQSMLAQRKAEIAPVVPLNIELSTEARAREREQFEEARRAREAELERQREERRRQQALEEEREIKELRRRAVPKANEVPEWYAHAPKKSKAGTGN